MSLNKSMPRAVCFLIIIAMFLTIIPMGAYAENNSESGIEITDYTAPEGKLESGQYFILKGKISSEKTLKNVTAGVYYRRGNETKQVVSRDIDSKEFDIKTIDEDIYFNCLPDGLYSYKIFATDDTGETYVLVESDFQIGNVSAESSFEISSMSLPSGKMGYGSEFNINYSISSVQPIYYVSTVVRFANPNHGGAVFFSEAFPNELNEYAVDKNYDFSDNVKIDFSEGNYLIEVFAVDYSGGVATFTSEEFEVGYNNDINVKNGVFPSGTIEYGKSFKIACDISSGKKLELVESKIYKRYADEEVCKISDNPDTENYTISAENGNTFDIADLETGEYTYRLTAKDVSGYEKVLTVSIFDVKISEGIKAENTSFPARQIKKGESAEIKCDIVSNNELSCVSGEIYNKDDMEKTAAVQEKEISGKRYSLSGLFIPDNLGAGNYTYRLIAKDNTEFSKTIAEFDFSIAADSSESSITISDVQSPSGKLKKGNSFSLRGNITSNYNLKMVSAKICLRSDNSIVQESSVNPDSKTYNIFPDIDYSMLFGKLNTGKYTYTLDAEDVNGYKANLVTSDFEVLDYNNIAGDVNLDGIIDISDVAALSAFVGNPEKNPLEEQGIINGDVHNSGDGLTANDALMIQQYLAGIIDNPNGETPKENAELFVDRIYNIVLERDRAENEGSNWIESLETNTKTAADVVLAFVQSSEYKSKNKTNQEYITMLYELLKDTQPDSNFSEWCSKAEMFSRNYILKAFVNTDEFNNICSKYDISRGDITLTENRDKHEGLTEYIWNVYQPFCKTTVPIDELNSITGNILSGDEYIEEFILDLVNYRFSDNNGDNSDYISCLYSGMLTRGASDEEISDKVSKIEKGQSRFSVFLSIAKSLEFKNVCIKYNISDYRASLGSISDTIILDSTRNVYNSNSSSSEVLGTAYEGQILSVTGFKGSWLEVKFLNGKGYVDSSYTSPYGNSSTKVLSVANIPQNSYIGGSPLPTGCEVTSLSVLMNYLGFSDASKNYLANNFMPKGNIGSTDPNYAFIGTPSSSSSYGAYANTIVRTAKNYFSAKGTDNYSVQNITGASMSDLYEQIDNGNPVLVWITMNCTSTRAYGATWTLNRGTAYTEPGTGTYSFTWKKSEHCCVMVGYNKAKGTVILADVLEGDGLTEYTIPEFESAYRWLGNQAIIIK